MATTKVIPEVLDLNESTSESGLKMPTGTNNNRPTASEGMIRNNTNEASESSASCEEYYNGTDWKQLNNVALPPEKVFKLLNWTGTAAEQAVTGFGNQPDLVIIKNYDTSSNSDPWYWFDSTRGATKYIQSASDAVEGTDAQTLKSFDSDGFTLGTNDTVNGSGHNTYGISWRVNGGTTSSNGTGSITSTVQANNETGISIVKYTGNTTAQTIGHGLSSAPEMIIVKKLGATQDWWVYHKDLNGGTNPAHYFIRLNLTDAESLNASSGGSIWNSTAPTSTVFSTGTTLQESSDYIAYCFTPQSDYSHFGSYTGSGSQGSPSVTCGFKPDFIIIKRASGAEQWWTGNSATNSSDHWTEWMPLQSNERLQSDTIHSITVTATGFEPYGTSDLVNGSGSTYIYMAFKLTS